MKLPRARWEEAGGREDSGELIRLQRRERRRETSARPQCVAGFFPGNCKMLLFCRVVAWSDPTGKSCAGLPRSDDPLISAHAYDAAETCRTAPRPLSPLQGQPVSRAWRRPAFRD